MRAEEQRVFARLNLPLSRAEVDRSAHIRTDDLKLSQLWESSLILHFNGEKFLAENGELAFLSASLIPSSLVRSETGERIFLGLNGENSYFLWCSAELLASEESYLSLREIGGELSDLAIGLAVHAQAVAHWHHKNQFCVQCGGKTEPALAGSVRRCIVDGSEHYPRTDPAIIVLLRDENDRILLGRQGIWPEHRFSTFAGFVEAGESFEHCVAREVAEEAGVRVSDIEYLGSQPWPFPSSMMIAFQATIQNPESARPDGEEIVEIRWFDRESILLAIRDNTLLLPPKISVARAMIEAWFAQGVDGTMNEKLAAQDGWR